MKLRIRAAGGSRDGVAILWVLLLSFAVMASSLVFATMSRSTSDLSQLHFERTRANVLSQAATEYAMLEIENATHEFRAPLATEDLDIGGLPASYTITFESTLGTGVAGNGLLVHEDVYRVEGSADFGNSHARTRRIVSSKRIPLFQFALFFENDMEFSYPAPMSINGRVHTNGRLFIRSNNSFTFNTNYVGAVQGIFNQSARTLLPGGTVSPTIRKWVADPFDPAELVEYETLLNKADMDALGIASFSGFDSSFLGADFNSNGDFTDPGDMLPFAPGAIENWDAPDFYAGVGAGHTLQTDEHSLLNLDVPEVESLDLYVEGGALDYEWDPIASEFVLVTAGDGTHAKGPYYAAADLSIISMPDGSWSAFNNAGLDVTAGVSAAITATDIYDARQAEGNGLNVQLTSIDLAALGTSGYFPAGGLLYLHGHGAATGTDAVGFRVTNGAELHDKLTVTSPNSVYVQGDYNTINKKPAAVIADAVNLLSNSWDDSKTPGNLPTASDTTYNCSFVTGDVEEIGGVFQGSAMNALRRHEDWSGFTETILGSIVVQYRSRFATGTYSNTGDYFRPPTRDWNYDTDLNDMVNHPAAAPAVIEVSNIAIL